MAKITPQQAHDTALKILRRAELGREAAAKAEAACGQYGITASELHERIIEDLRSWYRHNQIELPWWLENHAARPLEQTIRMSLNALL